MKIKRFDNLWTMGVILSAVILLSVYLLKIFIPEFVVEVAQIKSITKVGHYIDTHKWAWYLASGILSFVCYYFYCGACCERKTFNLKECLLMVVAIFILFIVERFFPKQYSPLNNLSMLLLPLLFKGKFKNTVICFGSLNLLQTITLEIRNLSYLIANYNFATLIILMIDVYIFQVLLYFVFNFKNKESE